MNQCKCCGGVAVSDVCAECRVAYNVGYNDKKKEVRDRVLKFLALED